MTDEAEIASAQPIPTSVRVMWAIIAFKQIMVVAGLSFFVLLAAPTQDAGFMGGLQEGGLRAYGFPDGQFDARHAGFIVGRQLPLIAVIVLLPFCLWRRKGGLLRGLAVADVLLSLLLPAALSLILASTLFGLSFRATAKSYLSHGSER